MCQPESRIQAGTCDHLCHLYGIGLPSATHLLTSLWSSSAKICYSLFDVDECLCFLPFLFPNGSVGMSALHAQCASSWCVGSERPFSFRESFFRWSRTPGPVLLDPNTRLKALFRYFVFPPSLPFQSSASSAAFVSTTSLSSSSGSITPPFLYSAAPAMLMLCCSFLSLLVDVTSGVRVCVRARIRPLTPSVRARASRESPCSCVVTLRTYPGVGVERAFTRFCSACAFLLSQPRASARPSSWFTRSTLTSATRLSRPSSTDSGDQQRVSMCGRSAAFPTCLREPYFRTFSRLLCASGRDVRVAFAAARSRCVGAPPAGLRVSCSYYSCACTNCSWVIYSPPTDMVLFYSHASTRPQRFLYLSSALDEPSSLLLASSSSLVVVSS